jgi:hypothetical protein
LIADDEVPTGIWGTFAVSAFLPTTVFFLGLTIYAEKEFDLSAD